MNSLLYIFSSLFIKLFVAGQLLSITVLSSLETHKWKLDSFVLEEFTIQLVRMPYTCNTGK